jgi:hypothetical protein
MLSLNPRMVEFGGDEWTGVSSVSISRWSERLLAEWGDEGPHAVLVDVPQERVTVEVVQELLGDDMDEPHPGTQGVLTWTTSAKAGDTPERRVTLTGVIQSVDYELSVRRGSVRRVKLVAVSDDGQEDPVAVTNA